MRAYIIATGVRIAPFDDPVADVSIGDHTLAETQDALFRRFGIEPVRVESVETIPEDEDRLVTYDDVYFTRRVLKSFLARWDRSGPARLALPKNSTFVKLFSWQQDLVQRDDLVGYRLFGFPAGASFDAECDALLGVIYKEKVLEIRVPHIVDNEGIWIHPMTSSLCLHIRHWVHLLDANRLCIQVRWVDQVLTHPLWALWIGFKALCLRRGRMVWRLLSAGNKIGRDVDIHPTACVEGCFIGDGVRIGAHVLVRGCIVGDGAVLEDRSTVAFSTIGARTFVSKYTLIYNCAVMEGANPGMSIQMCVVGKRASLTPRGVATDMLRGRFVKVRVGDEFIEVDHPVLGSCFGHDTFIGPDVIVAPGRELPNGLALVPDPARLVRRIPDGIDTSRPHIVRDGTAT